MIPLYHRIESLIRHEILTGQLEPGRKLPTEDDFIQQFGVSRVTVRNAFSHLEKEGLIVRRRSKGTYVSKEIPIKKKQFVFKWDPHYIITDANQYETKPISIHTQRVSDTKFPKIIKNFYNVTDDDEITLVKRVRLYDNLCVYYLENYLPSKLATNFTLQDLYKRTIHEILQEKINLKIEQGEMYMEAIPTDPYIAGILQCEIFDPLLFIQVFYRQTGGEPFEIVNRYVRADYFKFKVETGPSRHDGQSNSL